MENGSGSNYFKSHLEENLRLMKTRKEYDECKQAAQISWQYY